MDIKTPIRYPGGKSKAIKSIKDFVPDFQEMREPFLGGGSVFLYLKQKYPGRKYWINDLYYNLYCFWKTLQDDGERLSSVLREIKIKNNSPEKMRDIFLAAKLGISSTSDIFLKARNFYILNKNSYSGLTEIGTFAPLASEQNFTLNTIENLKYVSKLLQGVRITNMDYNELLKESGEDVFIYLDPPYKIKNNLYGKDGNLHKQFDHGLFKDNVDKCRHKLMISYNGSKEIEKSFEKYDCQEIKFSYAMSRVIKEGKKIIENKKEILIKNF